MLLPINSQTIKSKFHRIIIPKRRRPLRRIIKKVCIDQIQIKITFLHSKPRIGPYGDHIDIHTWRPVFQYGDTVRDGLAEVPVVGHWTIETEVA